MTIVVILFYLIVSSIVIFRGCKLNIYLAFVLLMSAFNFLAVLYSNNDSHARVSDISLILLWLATAGISVSFFRFSLNNIRADFYALRSCNYYARTELLLFFVILFCFYIVSTLNLLSSPWWANDESRITYMTENSTLLRGIKLTPIFFAAYLFSKPAISKTILMNLLLFSIVFSIYYGSKSGMIFLIATLSIYASVINLRLLKALTTFIVPILVFAIFIIFYFSKIAENQGSWFGEEILIRLGSDVIGLTRAFDYDFVAQCANSTLHIFINWHAWPSRSLLRNS